MTSIILIQICVTLESIHYIVLLVYTQKLQKIRKIALRKVETVKEISSSDQKLELRVLLCCVTYTQSRLSLTHTAQ